VPNDNSLKELLVSLANCPELAQLENLLTRFNIFEVLELWDRELSHSNVLAWLFDPRQNHGLQECFLKRWLKEVFQGSDSRNASDFPPVDIDAYSFESVKVRRECYQVFPELGYLDLLVEIGNSDGRTLVVGIENKVWSKQHSNQLARYREHITQDYPIAHHVFILLSVSGERPADRGWRTATYEQVLKALEDCLNDPSKAMDEEVRSVINQYIELVRSHLMPNSEIDPEIEKLARNIYAAHKQALDIIIRHGMNSFLRATVVKQIQEMQGEIVFRVTNPDGGEFIYLLPDDWDVHPNKTGQVAYLQLKWEDKAVLKGIMGIRRGDEKREASWKKWRQETFELVRKLDWKKIIVKNEILTGEWPAYYEVVGPKVKSDVIDTEATRKETSNVMSWFKEQIKDPKFTPMVKEIAKQLKRHPEYPSGGASQERFVAN
jgi:hypothetical protein